VTTVEDVVRAVDYLAPFALAEAWDNVGLLLGDGGREVRRLLVALDVGVAACDEAERLGAEAILAHHPLLFEPVRRLTAETRAGRLALRLLGQGRAVIAAHTNLDSAPGGLCDIAAGLVGMADLEPLQAAHARTAFKVVVFVPAAALAAVRAAAFEAGAGRIGDYTECSFSAEGEGTFLPGNGAAPAVGQAGRRSAVPERRFETLVAGGRLGAVLAAVARVHPYEEPAIDVFRVESPAAGAGIGRVGRLVRPRPLAALADDAKRAFGLDAIACAGDPARTIERVAVVTGGGGGLGDAVAAAGCQAYLTGELKYHETEDLAARGIGVILGGHHRTERVPLEAWVPRLAGALAGVEVLVCQGEREALRLR